MQNLRFSGRPSEKLITTKEVRNVAEPINHGSQSEVDNSEEKEWKRLGRPPSGRFEPNKSYRMDVVFGNTGGKIRYDNERHRKDNVQIQVIVKEFASARKKTSLYVRVCKDWAICTNAPESTRGMRY